MCVVGLASYSSIAPGSTLRATTGHLVGPHSLRPPPLCAGIGAVNMVDPLGHRRTTLNTCGRLMAYCQNFSVGHRGTMKSAAVPTGWRCLHFTKCDKMSRSSENGPLQNTWRPPQFCLFGAVIRCIPRLCAVSVGAVVVSARIYIEGAEFLFEVFMHNGRLELPVLLVVGQGWAPRPRS